LWIGNCDGGLARLHGDQLEILTERTNWPPLRVFSVCADSHRGVWIGTRTGLYFWQSDSNEIPREMETNVLRDIHVLYRDQNGDVWVGADPGVLGFFHNGTFKRYTAPDGFPDENVRAIEEDKSGRVWVGTEDGNLFERIGEKFVRFGVSDGLPGSAIRAMWSDSQGVIWIGTSGGGLIAREGIRFKRITKTQGLPDNSIFQILVDDRDRVWFGSPRGIFHIGRDELLDCIEGRDDRVHAVLFGRSDGLPSVSSVAIYQPTAWKTSKGQLWFATRQGLLEVDTPAERINTRPPPVFIDECLLEDHEIPLSEPVKIPPGRRKLEIRYSVLSYTAPEEVQIRYRLEGFDSDWVEAGSQRRAVFPQLPPGNYRFRVIASNNDGFWNRAGASLAFKVLPAWWQTIFFRVTAATLFAALVGAIVLYVSHRRLKSRLERFEQQQALERERARIARDLHDDLGARLTQISLLAEMTCRDSMPPERVRKNSAQLVVRARGLVRELDGILWTVNPKNDSLDKLAAYLCRFSEQFFHLTSISCRFDVAEEIPAHPLTPETRHDLLLAVKEAMNNIVKHSGATEVWLRMRMNDGGFEITIEDNGHGFKASADSDRNGLQNMRSRIESAGGNFELQSEMGEGTVIRIKLPLNRGRDGFLNRKFKTNA
jgi:signal transduction histidine kinase